MPLTPYFPRSPHICCIIYISFTSPSFHQRSRCLLSVRSSPKTPLSLTFHALLYPHPQCHSLSTFYSFLSHLVDPKPCAPVVYPRSPTELPLPCLPVPLSSPSIPTPSLPGLSSRTLIEPSRSLFYSCLTHSFVSPWHPSGSKFPSCACFTIVTPASVSCDPPLFLSSSTPPCLQLIMHCTVGGPPRFVPVAFALCGRFPVYSLSSPSVTPIKISSKPAVAGCWSPISEPDTTPPYCRSLSVAA